MSAVLSFLEVKRLCQRLRVTGMFIPDMYRDTFHNYVKGLFLTIYYSVYCRGRATLYRLEPENRNKLSPMEYAMAQSLMAKTQIIGWFVVRRFFSNEITNILLMTIEHIGDKKDKDGVNITIHIERYKK